MNHGTVMQASGGHTGRRESAPALLASYESLLAHLKSQGALLNSVKPELLLDIADFRFCSPLILAVCCQATHVQVIHARQQQDI